MTGKLKSVTGSEARNHLLFGCSRIIQNLIFTNENPLLITLITFGILSLFLVFSVDLRLNI